MKTIKVAPNKKDCRIFKNQIIGKMDDRTIILTLGKNISMPKDKKTRKIIINNFIETIALCSKSWQIEDLLNKHWNVEGTKIKIILNS